jgi:hypothetical protein
MGISLNESSKWQKLAALHEQDLRVWIDHQIEQNNEITTAAALKLANQVIRDQTQEENRDTLAAIGEAIANKSDLPVKVELVAGDFRDCLAQLPADSIDMIFNDPPDTDPVPLYTDLAMHATRVLKPGGHLLVFTPNDNLPEILSAMMKHLRYWWTLAVKYSGGPASSRQMDIPRMATASRVRQGGVRRCSAIHRRSVRVRIIRCVC